jgi:hypothetical protein
MAAIPGRELNPRPKKGPQGDDRRVFVPRMNWRDHASMDGYFFAYNWSGTISVTDNVPALSTGSSFSTVLAGSPQVIGADTAMIIKNGQSSIAQIADDGSITYLMNQLRLVEATRAQHCRISKPQPQPTQVLYNLLKVVSEFDETDLNPVFFSEDFNGGTGGATLQLSYTGAPLSLEYNRRFANSNAAIRSASSQIVFDIDFYERDPERYGRRV